MFRQKIVKQWPPNIARIAEVFPECRRMPDVYFSYGGLIFNPDGGRINPWGMAHEAAHGERQVAYQDPQDGERGIVPWWDRYLKDPVFRFDEEVIGHRAEYKMVKRVAPAVQWGQLLDIIAGRLSGPLYGNMCSLAHARKLVTNAIAS